MPRFTIAEPHPTVKQNTYTHSGRGGAGNYFRAPVTTPSSGVPTEPQQLPPSTSNFYSGRGGAGNAHVCQNRPVMSFDEEFRLQSQIAQHRVCYTGRGGAGNIYEPMTLNLTRKGSDSFTSSGSSTNSRTAMLIERVSSVFSHRH
ncbi:hypothetical protein GGS21DRAFT_492221 [Xylaria nigripes]|nr:hypothetical protein GGS21DRAFT_492221 [Xylaria nigripes]